MSCDRCSSSDCTIAQVTLDKSKPLTYEMAVRPEGIGTEKSFNSFNTGQLEDTLKPWSTYEKDKEKNEINERGGPALSHKMFIEDLFIRKFIKGTFAGGDTILSEIIVKRQHNTVRPSCKHIEILDCLQTVYFTFATTHNHNSSMSITELAGSHF